MNIFINADGTAQLLQLEHIYQGSGISQVNVYAPSIPNTATMQIAFKLPDGTLSKYYPMAYYNSTDNQGIWFFVVQNYFTKEFGAAAIALLITLTNGQQTSQLVPFTIEESILPVLPDTPSPDQWDLLLQYVQQNAANIAALQMQISDIEQTANEAKAASDYAVQTANQARATANSFAAEIQQANDTAGKARAFAGEALTRATKANDTANEAKATADGFAAEIQQANDTADEAKTIADEAKATAEEAKTKSQQAFDTAEQAYLISEANTESIQNLIGGNTAVGKAVGDKFGNPIDETYATNDYVNATFTPRTFFENLYFTRTGALTATLENTKPTANANNYLATTTTNTSFDFGSATKLTVTRTLATKLQLDKNDSIRIAMSFATNRNASIEFGARILIGGVAVSSNQAFGLNTVNGDTGFANVNDVSINITCDLIIGSQEFEAGQIVTIEIFTRQINAQSLITRYFCGVAVGGADRNCFAGINATATSINTNQIADGAVTTPKLADEAVTVEKLSPSIFGTGDGTVCEGNDGRLNNLLPDENGAINAGGRKSGSTVGNNSVGIGKDCEAGLNSVSIGTNSKATTSSVAIGEDARFVGASARDSYIIIGPSSEVSDYRAIAIGSGAKGYAIDAISIGANSQANANNSVQLGAGTNNSANTAQFLNKSLIDGDGNLYQNNIKLQELYEPLLDVDKLVPSVDNGWMLGGASGSGSVVLTKGRWLIKITNSEKGNSRIGVLYYDGTDNNAGCDIPGEDKSSTYRAIYTAPGWYWYRLVNGAWENLGGGAVYAKKV